MIPHSENKDAGGQAGVNTTGINCDEDISILDPHP